MAACGIGGIAVTRLRGLAKKVIFRHIYISDFMENYHRPLSGRNQRQIMGGAFWKLYTTIAR